MNLLKRLVAISVLLTSTLASVHADTITGEALDTMPGKGVGSLSGFLMGGFVSGGPLGALLGGGLGWLLGDKTQAAAGLGDTAYRVEKANGEVVIVRSPNKAWSVGDEVRIVGKRLVAEHHALEVSRR